MPERHKTDYQIRQIMKYNRDGSPDQQRARHQSLMRGFKHLQEKRGYSKRFDVHRFGKKEVCRLVHDMKERGLRHRSIANSLTHQRWLASKVGREEQIPSNKDLGLRRRTNEPNHGENKAIKLEQKHLDQMDTRMQLVNELKAEFGLREKEALKFQHAYATKENGIIRLKGSWCKNGRQRTIAIVNNRQRDLLDRINAHHQEHNEKSMIPKGVKYETYKNEVQAKSTEIGIKGHGFRHQWAQNKFEEMSGGIKSPHAGGPAYETLSDEERRHWEKAAAVVNQELGHGAGREDITGNYIGAK